MASPKLIRNPRVSRPRQRKLLGRSTVAARASARKKINGVQKKKPKMQTRRRRWSSYPRGTQRRKRRSIGSTKRTERTKQEQTKHGTKKVPSIQVTMDAMTTPALMPRVAIAGSAKWRRTHAPLRPPASEAKARARHQRIRREVGKNDIDGAKCRRTHVPLRPPASEVKARVRHQRIRREVGKNDDIVEKKCKSLKH